jgi:hypothetical protein
MTIGYATTNYPNGVTNAAVGSALQTYILPDPTSAHTYFNDFDVFTAADWTVTETQAGATQAIANGNGGWLALVNSAANNDLNAIQALNTTFAFTAGKALWFKCRFKLSNATNAAAIIGLQVIDTTPLAVTDGVFFSKPAASTTLSLVVEKTSTATTTTAGTMADDTFVEAGFHYDGSNSVFVYFNGNRVASSAVTNLPTVGLCVSIAVANGTAAANTMTVDYYLASAER